MFIYALPFALAAWTIFVIWGTLKCRALAGKMGQVKKAHVGVQCMLDQLDPEIVGRMTIDNVREELRKMEMATSGNKEELVTRLVRHKRREAGEEQSSRTLCLPVVGAWRLCLRDLG